jgi:hypothetical protein
MLFHIIKEDAADKHNAAYIVEANSAELNSNYVSQAFPKYSVSVEEIDLSNRSFYRLD